MSDTIFLKHDNRRVKPELRCINELRKYRLSWSWERRRSAMQIAISPQPVVSLIAGILILIFPKLLNYIVAIYLIVIGIIGLIRWLAGESSIAEKLFLETNIVRHSNRKFIRRKNTMKSSVRDHVPILSYTAAIYLIIIAILGLIRWLAGESKVYKEEEYHEIQYEGPSGRKVSPNKG